MQQGKGKIEKDCTNWQKLLALRPPTSQKAREIFTQAAYKPEIP